MGGGNRSKKMTKKEENSKMDNSGLRKIPERKSFETSINERNVAKKKRNFVEMGLKDLLWGTCCWCNK